MNYSIIEGVVRQTTHNPLVDMTQHITNTFEPEPHTRMNRFEKLEFLQETTAFKRDTILNELVGWLTDDDFNQFYEEFCSNWDICRSHEELDERYGA